MPLAPPDCGNIRGILSATSQEQACNAIFSWPLSVLVLRVAIGQVNATSARENAAGANAPTKSGQAETMNGDLDADGVPDYETFPPPPPEMGSPLDRADRRTFRKTRSFEGSARWDYAGQDAGIGAEPLIAAFGCALSVQLDLDAAPAMRRLLTRSEQILGLMIGESKDRFARVRLFVTSHGDTCVETTEALAGSGSYASGLAAVGWLYSLILAEVDPANAERILARGRAYGESRVVCGRALSQRHRRRSDASHSIGYCLA